MQQKAIFVRKWLAFTAVVAFALFAVGGSVALGALTFSGSTMTGDSSFTSIVGVASTTWDIGANTLSLQTTSNGPITTGTGLLTVGGSLTVTGTTTIGSTIDRSGTLAIGPTSATNILIGRSGQVVSFPGNVSSTGTLTVGTTTVTGLLTVNGSVSSTGATITGTLAAGTTTVSGSLAIGGGGAILKHISATSSVSFGAIASSSCATVTASVTGVVAGDSVHASPVPGSSGIESVTASWSAYASTTNVVAIKACNPGVASTASVAAQVWRIDVWQH